MFQREFHLVLPEICQAESCVCLREIWLEFQRFLLRHNRFRVSLQHRVSNTHAVIRSHKCCVHAKRFLVFPDRFLIESICKVDPTNISEDLSPCSGLLCPLQCPSQLVQWVQSSFLFLKKRHLLTCCCCISCAKMGLRKIIKHLNQCCVVCVCSTIRRYSIRPPLFLGIEKPQLIVCSCEFRRDSDCLLLMPHCCSAVSAFTIDLPKLMMNHLIGRIQFNSNFVNIEGFGVTMCAGVSTC